MENPLIYEDAEEECVVTEDERSAAAGTGLLTKKKKKPENWEENWEATIPIEIPGIIQSDKKTKQEKMQDCRNKAWQYIKANREFIDNPDLEAILNCEKMPNQGINGGPRQCTKSITRRVERIIDAYNSCKRYTGNYTDQMREDVISPFKLVIGNNGNTYMVGYIPK